MSEENNYEKRARAGLIPYLFDENGVIQYLTMIASDPKFGGPRPMISKGKIEEGEEPLQTAIREAVEELGLIEQNMAEKPWEVWSGRVELRSGAYNLSVYAVRIYDRSWFDPWCEETEYIEWMSLANFKEEGRRDHIRFLEDIERTVRSRQGD